MEEGSILLYYKSTSVWFWRASLRDPRHHLFSNLYPPCYVGQVITNHKPSDTPPAHACTPLTPSTSLRMSWQHEHRKQKSVIVIPCLNRGSGELAVIIGWKGNVLNPMYRALTYLSPSSLTIYPFISTFPCVLIWKVNSCVFYGVSKLFF